MHYSFDELEWLKLGDTGWERASVTLGPKDTADNPASTLGASQIFGPAVVAYERAPDGGINARVEDVPA